MKSNNVLLSHLYMHRGWRHKHNVLLFCAQVLGKTTYLLVHILELFLLGICDTNKVDTVQGPWAVLPAVTVVPGI